MRSLVFLAAGLVACASSPRPFPLREPLWQDTDLASVRVACHAEPTSKDPAHVSCAPRPYDSPLYWDGADNLFFRPFSEMLGVVTSRGESVNVNSMDEVPDSAWFQNRLGRRAIALEDFRMGACAPEQILDGEHAADGTWVIDKGKSGGSTPGFRLNIPGKGKYLVKLESIRDEPERQAASSVIGAAVMHAAGYYTSCEQVVYVRPQAFKLQPGLVHKANFEAEKPFDQRVLDAWLADSPKRGDRIRMSASAWVPGYNIGPFRLEGTRDDDPNDVIPHEDRRELRGMRVLASWIDRFDAREANSLDAWSADAKKGPPDSSPGHVVHYQLDTSEALGSVWNWDQISRRLGRSYVIDWGDMAVDFFGFGIPTRSWDLAERTKGHEIFGYFNVKDFVPDAWKSEYPNQAFSRTSERDAAWMARILARFTPEMVAALAKMGDFSDPNQTAYLTSVLEGRLHRVLERYLMRLSPITDVSVDAQGNLCGVDLAELRALRPANDFHYSAQLGGASLPTTRGVGSSICIALPRAGGYMRVVVRDGIAGGPLVAHLYDLGQAFQLVGIERPSP